MKPFLSLLALLLLVPVVGVRAGTFVLEDDFVDYMKSVTNPDAFGVTAGIYRPYSTPYGRLIGYGLPPTGTSDFTSGISESTAESRLRTGLGAIATALSSYIPAHYPGRSFEDLDADRQEILVDHAFTQGVDVLPSGLVDAVYATDTWDRLAHDMLYVRVQAGLVQLLPNRAFFNRWLKPRGY